ncbi:kelch repeat-containing protein [Ekhidna sp.]|uniref:kelch repeat-containing protein n=1 Tax=Ekhidna sp. TaxID=2608089 RepID=UPI003B59495B
MRQLLALLLTGVLFYSCSSPKQPQDSAESITFQLIDNRPFIEVEVNGVKGKFIVDTGGTHGFNEDFAEAAGIVKADSFSIQGAGDGTQMAWRSDEAKIKIVGTFINTIASSPLIINLNAIRDSLSLPFLDGVIGVQLFRAFDVSIHYPDRLMTFYEKGNHPTEGYDAIPFSFYRDQIPMVKLKINNNEVDFTVDTGDRSKLTIFPEFYEKIDTENIELSELRTTGYGVGGPIMAREFNLGAAELGANMRFITIKTRVPEHSAGAWANNSHAGNIGSGLLKDCEVIFDYNKQVMLIKEQPLVSIDEFVYHSANFDSTTQWYLDHLPFEETARTDSSVTLQYQLAKIKFIKSPQLPTLWDYKSERANKEPNGVFKFGFNVPDPQALIKESFPNPEDIMFGRSIVFWGTEMFLVRDPEGNVVQFFQGGSYWKNSFYALITNSPLQYQMFLDFVKDQGMAMHSDFSNDSTGVNQQNFEQGDIKIELLKLDMRAEEPFNGIGASGVQLDSALKSLSKSPIPPPRHHSAVVFANGNIYQFGGTSMNGWTGHSDFWKLHEQRWSKLPAYGPSPRSSLALFTTPNSKAIYLLGGWDDNNVLEDFWKYENGEWVQLNESTLLGQRYSPGVAYDKKNDRMILYGGCGPNGQNYGDTWAFQNGEWKLIQSQSTPGERCRPQLAYDEVNEKVLLFGGSGGDLQTWTLDDNQWKIVADAGPAPRYNHSMTGDESRKRIVLFGGAAPGGVRFNDTWEWDGNAWKNMNPSDGPSKRDMSVMVYDPSRKLTFLLGGRTPKWNPADDLWTWNGTNWTKIK